MKLRPSTFKLNLIVRCPICGDEHWFSPEEIRGKAVLICCGRTFEVEQAKKITVGLKYGDDVSIPENAIKILRDYGFSLEQIKKSNIKSSSDTEFVRLFLASQHNEPASNFA